MSTPVLLPEKRTVTIYIAGPYRGADWGDVKRNVAHAMDLAAEVLRMGYTMLCPHTMTHTFEMYDIPERTFLLSGLQLLSLCDAVLVADNWGASEGTRAEIAQATALGLPVLYEQYGAWVDKLPQLADEIIESRKAKEPEAVLW